VVLCHINAIRYTTLRILFTVYWTALSVALIAQRRREWCANNELERIWWKAEMIQFGDV
jgi:hypothetical protein